MGIINCTPDSFSDGGLFQLKEHAVNQALRLLDEGADIIDIGGESTRPGSDSVSMEDELSRTIPVIKSLVSQRPGVKISIDTTKAIVAKHALDNGAFMVNDVSAISHEEEQMSSILREYKPVVSLMHMKGKPKTMQTNPTYDNVVKEVFSYLQQRILFVQSLGCNEIIADVGIGFGKTLEHNLTLLKHINTFTKLDVPLLLGISRKRFLGMLTGIEDASKRDIATLITHTLLLKNDIAVIRTHSIEPFVQMKKISEALENC
ncbi:MAG: dihydropteroate synthase [Candidatus Kapabacteria bacterium]|nr:dihydropteroate synthase [Candidatus Kapabacteria bacterium]